MERGDGASVMMEDNKGDGGGVCGGCARGVCARVCAWRVRACVWRVCGGEGGGGCGLFGVVERDDGGIMDGRIGGGLGEGDRD